MGGVLTSLWPVEDSFARRHTVVMVMTTKYKDATHCLAALAPVMSSLSAQQITFAMRLLCPQ